ncbi:tellurite resistance/C4-dicarboxylate transporter family protein [uncultured Ornithinimicrobium sp.]|uniref:tellurite resistance/C4-dicarboxylate transporter family protein n=1 Tax=uncultured Ornithinimicrobium sp. TaxID=259307 RepID=UPI00259575DE|nr:tellurite resistance/C4-dicarboxylate transporter family protein [uncultured Ornithinimicrobium sp.]
MAEGAPSTTTDTGAPRPLRLTPAGLTPGYFAGVMATGIVSIGAQLRGFTLLATALFWAAVVFYVVLVVLTAWRFASHRHHMSDDFHDPARAFGFFTFIAATNVLGAALVGVGQTVVGGVLLAVSVLVWLVLGYVIPWTAVLGSDRRPMLDTANGTWFIWVVASQSIAVVAASLEPIYDSMRHELAILAVFAWSVGVVLYAATAVFVALRVMLYPLEPKHLDPPYWVAMGAVAITIVAGARIVEMKDAPMIDVTRDLVAGMSVVFWAFATWLIPVLLAAGVWRHGLHRIPLVYQPTLWSMVFPFGMYAVAGMYLGRANQLPVVEAVGASWFWVALFTWAAVAVGMLRSVVRVLTSRPTAAG